MATEPVNPAVAAAHGKLVQSAEVMKGSTVQMADSADRRTELAADRTVLAAEGDGNPRDLEMVREAGGADRRRVDLGTAGGAQAGAGEGVQRRGAVQQALPPRESLAFEHPQPRGCRRGAHAARRGDVLGGAGAVRDVGRKVHEDEARLIAAEREPREVVRRVGRDVLRDRFEGVQRAEPARRGEPAPRAIERLDRGERGRRRGEPERREIGLGEPVVAALVMRELAEVRL